MQVKQRWTDVTIVTPSGIKSEDLLIDGDRFAGHVGRNEAVADDWKPVCGQGAVLYPGMIDLLQHGMGRHLYADAEPGAVADASAKLLTHGTTGFLPSFGCLPPDRRWGVLADLADQCEQATGARALGVHSEGPCFALPGAHNPENVATPGPELAKTMIEQGRGKLRAVTVSPELPGAEGFIRTLKAGGVSVHLGHSAADPESVSTYVSWGIDAVTHMFNVMPTPEPTGTGIHPLSLSDALLAEADLPLGLVCDGIHVHPALVALLAQLPRHRVFLETDAMKYAGGADTTFEFYPGYRVRSEQGNAVRDERGGLCGSSLTPDEAMRNYRRMAGIDLVRTAHATSLVPARVIGMDSELGSIEAGKLADFVVLEPETGSVRATYIGGKECYGTARTEQVKARQVT